MKSLKRIVSALIVVTLIASLLPALAFRADATKVYGIDVSKWQGTIDWAKVKAAGVKFAIIRIGTSQGKDGKFEANYTAATAQGIDVGIYFYTYSKTKAATESDAQKVLTWLNGRKLEYPVYFDLEDNSLLSGYTNTDRTNFCIWFNTVIENAGYFAGVYTGYYWLNNYVNKATLTQKYAIWMARYLNSGTDSQDYSNLCGMWQYSSKGSVNGISGNVDMNVCYVDYPTIIKTHGFNGYGGSGGSSGGGTTPTVLSTGYYTINTGALNIRQGPGTSYDIVTSYTNGTQVAAVGFNSDYSWANVRCGSTVGWCSAKYLSFVKAFPVINVGYDAGGLNTSVPASSQANIFTNYTVSATAPSYGGYSFLGWNLKRSSDGKWQASDGSWTSDANASLKLYAPSSTLSLDESAVNSSATIETFTFTAKWEYIAQYQMGYYTVTTNTSPLNIRDMDSTSGGIVAKAPKGSEVAVFGFNSDVSWARVVWGEYSGWCSMTYLTFKEAFGVMTVSYDMNGVEGVFCPSSVCSPFDTFEIGGDGIEAEDYEFTGFTLTRLSDGKTYSSDGSWQSSAANARVFQPGEEFSLGYANLNRAVQNDTYSFKAGWIRLAMRGDVNGDGLITAQDMRLLKQYLVGLIGDGDIDMTNADVNSDGDITAKDSRALKDILVQ